MSTTYSDRRLSDEEDAWSPWEMARLLFHWLGVGAAIVLIGSLFLLSRIFATETVPILVSAFAMLGIGLAGFCLWALAVGLPTVRRFFYGPVPMWQHRREETASTPWFDQNGMMLWQRDGRGRWVRKLDLASRLAGASGQNTNDGYR